jgi:hypothetical protein
VKTKGVRSAHWVFIGSIALFVVAATIKQVHALMLYNAEFICPIGGEKFTAEVVGSYTQFGVRLDLKPFGALIAPIPLPVCPKNGFVMYKSEFSETELEQLKPLVLSDDYRRTRAEHTDYYMVAYLRERMGADSLDLGFLYLKASWEAEDKRALLTSYRSLALTKFDDFLTRDNSESGQWWIAAIVVAELERLLGHFDAAEERLAKLPKSDPGSIRLQMIDQIRGYARKSNSDAQNFAKN